MLLYSTGAAHGRERPQEGDDRAQGALLSTCAGRRVQDDIVCVDKDAELLNKAIKLPEVTIGYIYYRQAFLRAAGAGPC